MSISPARSAKKSVSVVAGILGCYHINARRLAKNSQIGYQENNGRKKISQDGCQEKE